MSQETTLCKKEHALQWGTLKSRWWRAGEGRTKQRAKAVLVTDGGGAGGRQAGRQGEAGLFIKEEGTGLPEGQEEAHEAWVSRREKV